MLDALKKFFRTPAVNGEEVAYRQTGLGPGKLAPFNPDDLVGRKGLQIYKTMMADEQIKAGISAKQYAVLSPGWDVIPPAFDGIVSPARQREADDHVRFILF